MPTATTLGSMVTYHEKLLTIKSHDPLTTWSCEITIQTKNISPLAKVPMAAKFGRIELRVMGSCPLSHMRL